MLLTSWCMSLGKTLGAKKPVTARRRRKARSHVEGLETRQLLSAQTFTARQLASPFGQVAASQPSPQEVFDQRLSYQLQKPQFEVTPGFSPTLMQITGFTSQSEGEASNVSGANDAYATGELLPNFGTGTNQENAYDIAGSLNAQLPNASRTVASIEPDSSTAKANETQLLLNESVRISGAITTDAPTWELAPDRDVDMFVIRNVHAGEGIYVTLQATDGSSLVPVIFAENEDVGFVASSSSSFDDSRAASVGFKAPVDGDYIIDVTASFSGFEVSSGAYTGQISRIPSFDQDTYVFDLRAGDVIGVGVIGAPKTVSLLGLDGALIVNSPFPSYFGQSNSPLPRTGNATAEYIAATDGRYAVQVGGALGNYNLAVRAARPGLEQQPIGAKQVLYLDFDGATVTPETFGGFGPASNLSSLSTFLSGWGLAESDEPAVIDAITAVVRENFADIAESDINGDFAKSGVNGDFDLEIVTSRDLPDPFGLPYYSRIVVGGTIDQLGIPTIGIAQSIDVGNFDTEETAVVLLDLLSAEAGDPNSVNSLQLAPNVSIIDAVATVVGNVISHEAGHFFGLWHTHPYNDVQSIIDSGAQGIPSLAGVGLDGIFGTGDDVDVDFVTDAYNPDEGKIGDEEGKLLLAYGLSTGTVNAPLPIAYDYGDAPAPYPTTQEENGARHRLVPGVSLGLLKDAEPNGIPSIRATADDNTQFRDEDGVEFVDKLRTGVTTPINVTASTTGFLNAWFDFNSDGDWNDAGEQVFVDTPLVAGVNALNVSTPSDATTSRLYSETAAARFRFTTTNSHGELTPTGTADDGEVEDYPLTILHDIVVTTDSFVGLANDGRPDVFLVQSDLFNLSVSIFVSGYGYQTTSYPLGEINNLRIVGSNDDDLLKVRSASGIFGLPIGGITFDAGGNTNGDELQFADAFEGFYEDLVGYFPSSTEAKAGRLAYPFDNSVLNSQAIEFHGVEKASVQDVEHIAYELTPKSDNVMITPKPNGLVQFIGTQGTVAATPLGVRSMKSLEIFEQSPNVPTTTNNDRITLRGNHALDRVEIVTGDGNDFIDFTKLIATNAYVASGDGSDYVATGNGRDYIVPDPYYTDSTGSDSVYSGLGNDTIYSAGGRDLLYGGAGSDQIIDSGISPDTIHGGAGDDYIVAGPDYFGIGYFIGDEDRVFGDAGDDLIVGGGSDDYLDGGEGSDFILGGTGDDIIVLGNGNDYALGDDGDDDISGGAGDDRIDGGTGDDSLRGGAGRDALFGGDGRDFLDGNAGRDTLSGGAGRNTIRAERGEINEAFSFDFFTILDERFRRFFGR